MTSSFLEQYTGLFATPELVGREAILQQFEIILNDTSPISRLVFLSGPGGIGKTRLLKKALEMSNKLKDVRTSEDVLDFYHVLLHTPIGLTNAIFEALTPPLNCFQTYQPAYQALNRARLSGNVVELKQLRQDALEKFDQDIKRLTQNKRLVLALDTVERVVYGLPGWTDEIPLADSWNWFIERLSDWQNVVIFLAGRETARLAIDHLKATTTKTKKMILLDEVMVGPFNLDESLKYFDVIAQDAKKIGKGDSHVGERLDNLNEDFKRGAHAYSQGRPILLSLLADYLSVSGTGEIPDMLRQTPPAEISEAKRHQFEEALIGRLREGEVGETLIALGRLPKGADEELLASILDISPAQARQRLADVEHFSVVKIRPNDQRVFLHDEMYALLQRHVYDSPHDIQEQKDSFEAIKKYYTDQRDQVLEHLNELYAPVEEYGKESLEMELLSEAHAYHQTLLTEMMYYSLRHDLSRGFRNYYRYSHEAIHSRDVLMDLQLQAELLSFLSTYQSDDMAKSLFVEMILTSLKLRPIIRGNAMSDYQTSLETANNLLNEVNNEWQDRFPPVLALLHTWIASLSISHGLYEDAEINIQKAFSILPIQAVGQPFGDLMNPDTFLWYQKVVRALTHRIYGYLKRVQGFLNDSVEEYQKAASLLREVDLRVEMAIVFNDMGFAQAERGEWHDGQANVQNALSLRRGLGHRIPIALSLNTLATIDVREGQYAPARENAERALSIFRVFSDKRYIGMALNTLAEAIRRYAGSTQLLPVEERIELLRRARDYAREANGHFGELSDTARQVESLIELGCACRDWVWWRKSSPRPGDNIDRTRSESEEALKQAADLAKNARLIYRHLDALVNLAWLQFYVFGSIEKDEVTDNHPIFKLISDAKDVFPKDDELARQPQVWAQKGKLYVLEGHVYYRIFEQQRHKYPKGISPTVEMLLREVAEQYAKGLDYSARFAVDYQGIRQAKDGIFKRLTHLNAAELRVICTKIRSLYPGGSTIQVFLANRALWLAD